MSGFAQQMAKVAMYLAVTANTTVLGLMLGTVAHLLWWPQGSRLVVQSMAGVLGLGLGLWWCVTVGRRWLREDEEASDGGTRSRHD